MRLITLFQLIPPPDTANQGDFLDRELFLMKNIILNFKRVFFLIAALATPLAWATDAAHVVFMAGDVTVAGHPAQAGQKVAEGQALTTGKDGYLHLETLDKGFLILRPNSTARIVTYQVDTNNPANNRIKLELQNGVARHISGDAVKAARQNFRFNTPVAAIGVRGTDFTIFANQDETRIAVLSGGIIVSPLGGTCNAGGFGPCDGPASRELFASQTNQIVQVNRGQLPTLLQGLDQSPDATTPAHPAEPSVNKTNTGAAAATSDPNLAPLKSNLVNDIVNKTASDSANAPPRLIWGRWQPLLDKSVEVDVNALQASNLLVATNAYYALMRSNDTAWTPPAQASIGFSLQQAQAVIASTANRVTPASVENGQLQINFAQSSFFTRFDLITPTDRIQLQNTGQVSPSGQLYGNSQFAHPSNMEVRGALASDNRNAAYLFQSRLDDDRLAIGATYWGR